MLFNSLDFAIFLPIVFVLYWFIINKNLKFQNLLIVGASYLFYGWWDYRFLSLILFSTLVDFFVGILLQKEQSSLKRSIYLWISILVNIGFLGFFKYYNFFIDNFTAAFSFLGNDIQPNSLNIILPVGISFYTFQTLSYSIDVYKKKLEPTKDIVAFAAFVSFFPQLVAGPIERATNLLPQFYKKRNFEYPEAVKGMRQILWGLFKKIVVADNCATIANLIFNNSGDYSGSTLVLGALFFTFQIYGDFSGYSDIAIGTSRLFGFNLKQNFAFPYFSRDIAEFWRRWHISLSTWFRDYLYIPLGGSRGSTWMKIRNTFIIFVVSGFWHGANWTFIIWGFLNAVYIMPSIIFKTNRNNLDIVAKDKFLPSMREFFSILLTFVLTVFAWIFFRANNVHHAISYISEICSYSLFSSLDRIISIPEYLTILILVVFLVIEWLGRNDQFAIENVFNQKNRILRIIIYTSICVSIVALGNFNKTEFIYFAF
jgi:D-alanyl-lipoteichoic acid acyltransferase DltB (MBOAT superfamily)